MKTERAHNKITNSQKNNKSGTGNPARRCRLSFLNIFECESITLILWSVKAVKLVFFTNDEDIRSAFIRSIDLLYASPKSNIVCNTE